MRSDASLDDEEDDDEEEDEDMTVTTAAAAVRTCSSIALRAARTRLTDSSPRNLGGSRSPAATADAAVVVLTAF